MSSSVHRHVAHVMGMPISLALRGRHAHDAHGYGAWAEVMAALHDVDRVFSTYRDDSVVSRLDRGEIDLADCPPEVVEVLGLGAQAERESGGAFRIHLPGPDGRTRLDPSGVVKGWAVDRAARPLRALVDTDFCLSAGGDLVCRTLDPTAAPWRIGIENPHDPTGLVAVVPVLTGAVATSGTVHRGRHLVDARTGEAPAGVASVTVVADSLTWADIDATAAYALGRDAARWLRTRPGRRGLVVWADGTTDLVSTPWDASGSASPAGPTPAGAGTSTRPAWYTAGSWSTRPSG
ncbi:FAD:protein FMN transferase [Nocardioides sp. MAHUQ-72]|uniref:FAD:protein FMN transferase n=1 Tax=unclassified Nocardioides TaxID=2615069 RepID=UPI003607BD19